MSSPASLLHQTNGVKVYYNSRQINSTILIDLCKNFFMGGAPSHCIEKSVWRHNRPKVLHWAHPVRGVMPNGWSEDDSSGPWANMLRYVRATPPSAKMTEIKRLTPSEWASARARGQGAV